METFNGFLYSNGIRERVQYVAEGIIGVGGLANVYRVGNGMALKIFKDLRPRLYFDLVREAYYNQSAVQAQAPVVAIEGIYIDDDKKRAGFIMKEHICVYRRARRMWPYFLTQFSDEQTFQMFAARALCRALANLHASGFTHGDLKNTNCVFDGTDAHFIDLCYASKTADTQCKKLHATMLYCAADYGKKAPEKATDCYALGVTLLGFFDIKDSNPNLTFHGHDDEFLASDKCQDIVTMCVRNFRKNMPSFPSFEIVAEMIEGLCELNWKKRKTSAWAEKLIYGNLCVPSKKRKHGADSNISLEEWMKSRVAAEDSKYDGAIKFLSSVCSSNVLYFSKCLTAPLIFETCERLKWNFFSS